MLNLTFNVKGSQSSAGDPARTLVLKPIRPKGKFAVFAIGLSSRFRTASGEHLFNENTTAGTANGTCQNNKRPYWPRM
jgi:hypothetical protein